MTKKKAPEPDYTADIKALMLAVFKDNPNRPLNYKQVIKKFFQEPYYETAQAFIEGLDEGQVRLITLQLLETLAQTEVLEETDKGKYRLFPEEKIIVGRIDLTTNGNAYVINEDFEDDIFIPRGFTKNAMGGDLVKVSLFAKRKGKRSEGEVLEIVERAKTEFVGRVDVSDRFAFLVSDNQRGGVDMFIPLQKLNGATHGMKAVARMTEWLPDAKNPSGEIVRVLGMPGENNAEMDAILVEYGFPLEFPAVVEKEAEEIPYTVSKAEIKKRRDFRSVTTFTIDPVDAKDFDDALSVQFLDNGHIEVGVHIADVSHYVTPGTELDTEAFSRATSIYLVDRVIPMLPEKLSNMVCSLRPGEDKLCYSAVFILNEEAEIQEEWFGRTVIHSQHRFTYEQAQEVIETGKGPLSKEVLKLQALAQILRKDRFKKGAISFEKVEVKFRLDERGMPIDVYLKENKDSNKLIEEFMLLANRRVAEFVGKKLAREKGREMPFVYRVHDTPSQEKLGNFVLFAGRFGHKINTKTDREIAHSLNELMKNVKGKKEQNVIEQLAIRTMAKAIYTTDNIGHYGLSFDYYTHFTSPIRRYPDVMVHRLLDYYLKEGKPGGTKELKEQCKHSTDMEIRASEAERASIKFKQAQFLQGREGEVFKGLISGVTEWGIYVELLDNKCEGLIRIRDLDDDFYELDEQNYCLVGHRSRRRFQLGDVLEVQLKSVDLMRKQIDFVLYDEFKSIQRKGDFQRREEGRGNGFRVPAAGSSRSGKGSSSKGKKKDKGGSKSRKRR